MPFGGIIVAVVVGEYIARTYIQGKNRPVYIEKEVLKAKKISYDEQDN